LPREDEYGIQGAGNTSINRFFALDARVYEDGALPAKVCSASSRGWCCAATNCITYHVIRRREESVSDPSFYDAFAVALVVGGSIVIPHLRRAVARLGALPAE
jgi:hypothetical protein